MKPLRAYQSRTLDLVSEEWHKGALRVIAVGPTGCGKTLTATHGVARAVARNRRALWLAPRIELIDQAAATLEDEGMRVGVIAASSDRPIDLEAPVQVASVQTLLARGIYPTVDLVVADEAHHFGETAAEWSKLFTEHYPRTRVLGLTATPERGDGSGLAPLFDALVVGCTVRELVDLNATDPSTGLVWCDVDRPGRMLKSGELAQPPVKRWLEVADGRPTIAFARNVEKAEDLAREFAAAGVSAKCVHGKTPARDRAFALEAFRAGLVKVLTCVYVLTEGTDLPMAEVCLLARGAGTQGIFLQMVGRVLRPSPATGKRDALLIDLQGVSWLHRMPEDPRIFSLTGRGITVANDVACPVCKRLLSDPAACAFCGWVRKPGDDRSTVEKITGDPMQRFARLREQSPEQRYQTLVRWIRAEMLKGHKPTAVFHKWAHCFRERLSPNAFQRAMREVPKHEIDAWKALRKERAA